MIKAEPAIAFKFVKYWIPSFSYEETGNENSEYNISFEPSGEYNESLGVYLLKLNFKAHDKEDPNKLVININGIAEFKFDKNYKFEDLPSHFFLSAIPIFFPYLRAFISTLTLHTNSNVIVLGLMNFTKMADPLKQNTSIKQ